MPDFRFVGTTTTIYRDHKPFPVQRFGQTVTLTDEEAAQIYRDRRPFLTPEEFNRYGFDPKDLERWGYWTLWKSSEVPKAFLDKVAQAQAEYTAKHHAALRAELANVPALPATGDPINAPFLPGPAVTEEVK